MRQKDFRGRSVSYPRETKAWVSSTKAGRGVRKREKNQSGCLDAQKQLCSCYFSIVNINSLQLQQVIRGTWLMCDAAFGDVSGSKANCMRHKVKGLNERCEDDLWPSCSISPNDPNKTINRRISRSSNDSRAACMDVSLTAACCYTAAYPHMKRQTINKHNTQEVLKMVTKILTLQVVANLLWNLERKMKKWE